MNRREALAALVAMPEVARISAIPGNTDDVLVVEADHPLSDEESARIAQTMKQIWPTRQVVVLSQGLRIKLAQPPK